MKIQGIKLFILLLICTWTIFGFSYYAESAFQSVISPKSDRYSEETTIGGVNVAGDSQYEAMTSVDAELTHWLKKTEYKLTYKEVTLDLALDYFYFDIKESVRSAEDAASNNMIVKLNDEFEAWLAEQLDPMQANEIQMEELETNLISSAGKMEAGTYQFKIEDYLTAQDENEGEIISEVKIPLQSFDSDTIALLNTLSNFEIEPASSFSLADALTDQNQEIILESAASNIVASGIYEAILPTNFSIAERSISYELPEYTSIGFEAKVGNAGEFDLKFLNPNEQAYKIETSLSQTDFIITLKGIPFFYSYEVEIANVQKHPFKAILQYDPKITAQQVKKTGQDGTSAEIYRMVYDHAGNRVAKELISQDYYAPIHEVVVHRVMNTTPSSDSDDEAESDPANNKDENDSNSNFDADEGIQDRNDTQDVDEPQQGKEENEGNKSDEDGVKSNSDLWGNEIEKVK